MPTKRQRKRRNRIADVSPALWAILTDTVPDDPSELYFLGADDVAEAWELCRAEILAEWIKTKGGTRPAHWWRFDAPRLADVPERFAPFARAMIEPRRLLSGAGRPAWEALAIVPFYRHGTPGAWIGWSKTRRPCLKPNSITCAATAC